MQIGSVNVVLTSTPKQFSGVSLGMNLLIYLIGASVGPVIAGTFMQANQVFIESETNNISASFPSPESYDLTFLTAALIAVIINRICDASNQKYETPEWRYQRNWNSK